MRTRDKYVAVNGAWPVARDKLPPLTGKVALAAFRALYLHRFHHRWTLPVKVVRGARRRTWPDWVKVGRRTRRGYQRQVMAMILAPDAGWHSFIHDLSHWMHRRQYPGQNPHRGSAHACVERDLIEKVVNSGWLNLQPAAEHQHQHDDHHQQQGA